MNHWAHSGSPEDQSDWQRLVDHLRQVAALAAERGAELGIGQTAGLAGLLHDLGKYDPAFQRYIEGRGPSVEHSAAGAAMLLDRANGPERAVAELVAYCILGHHAGLPDREAADAASFARRIEGFAAGGGQARLDPAWMEEIPLDLAGTFAEVRARVRGDPACAGFDLSVVVRMLFSCLVDADFKDTEAHFARIEGREVDRAWPALGALLPELIERFNAYMAKRPRAGELNALRRDILAQVRGKAAMAPGLFTLTVPTGGGKTLASLGFALDHARAHGHRRVIYAIPFTSIIDQTAAIFCEVLGDEVVLEHHSAIEEGRAGRSEDTAARDRLRLAREDWAAPVVVTTNVQLFESLFAARPSRARKLHNVAGSVIVLDEAQTIPRPLLLPCVRMLDALAANWGCSIVLCTATQPALGRDGLGERGLPLEGRELAPDPAGLADALRRARIVWGGPMDDAALVEALRWETQALVVVNSRRHALELYRSADAAGLEGLVHLSTRQHATDRRRLLDEVRRRLAAGEPCRVVATSLVEAGVDLDFPSAWRAEAGLDQIIQAAGRVNREGRRPWEESVVTVFQALDHPPPKEVAGLIGDTARMLDRHRDDPLALGAIRDYFGEVYWRMGNRLDGKGIVPRLNAMTRAGTDFAFRSVAADFRMIESGLAPVIVPTTAEARREVERLGIPKVSSGGIARALQPFVVQVPPKARARLIANGKAEVVRPDVRGDQFVVLTDMALYHADTGLVWEDADYLSTEDSII